MALPRRMRLLVVIALIGSLGLLAGCATITDGGGESTVELGAITVENSDETTHTIHVLVERDSQPVYGTSVSLEGVEPPANESDFGSIDSAVLSDAAWRDESANWTVYTRIDSNTSWQAHAVSPPTDGDCTAVRLKIEADGSVTSFTPSCAAWPPSTDT